VPPPLSRSLRRAAQLIDYVLIKQIHPGKNAGAKMRNRL
jgi:hypothetical protein